MPALTQRALDGWIPGHAPAALQGGPLVLIHGGDEGGVAALAADALRGMPSPIRITADGLNVTDLRAHLSTGGLFGAPAPVRIGEASDKHLPHLRALLDGLVDSPTVIVEAGILKKDSKLKAYAEAEGTVAVLHPLDAKAAGAWLARSLQTLGVALAPKATKGAESRLPSDRMRLIRMAEVLALHAQARGSDRVEACDITALIGQEADVELGQPLMAALAGNTAAALTGFDSQMGAGENPIALLRAWGWKLHRLDDMVRSGKPPAQAVASARPPVFFTERAATERALARLGGEGVGFALEQMDSSERAIVHGGQPARLVLERWLLRLSLWKP